MDRAVQYYIRIINKSIANNNKTDAEMYYKKAVANIGEIPEIHDLKSKINTLQEPTGAESKTIDNLETKKIKKNNETKITIIAIGVAIVALITYLCIAVFPKHNLNNKIGHEWYQGDVSSYHSDGLMLEFKHGNNYDFEIIYKQYEGMPIAEFECQVLNGHQISVDGQTINVRFEDDGEKIIFSPSFVDLSEESVWKKYSSFGGNEPFYIDDSSKNNKDNKLENSKKASNESEENENSFTETESHSEASKDNKSENSKKTSNKSEENESSFTEAENNNDSSENAKKNNSESSNNGAGTKTSSESKSSVAPKTESKSSSATKNEPKDPCANGHSWVDATCTKPKTCKNCGKTSGVALGHDVFMTKCRVCGQTNYSNISGTYTNTYGFYSNPYKELNEISSFTINSSGVVTFNLSGTTYSFKIIENYSDYSWDATFDCYSLSGTKENSVTARSNLDFHRTLLCFHLEWKNFDGRDLYFMGEKRIN